MAQPLSQKSLLSFVVVSLLAFCVACEKLEPLALDSEKEIVTIKLKRPDGSLINLPEVSFIFRNDTIFASVPFYTDRTQVIPDITITGKTVSPASGAMQDFTRPVSYTVTAKDGTQRVYVVIVSLANAGGVVYFGSSDKNFYALDAITGKMKWKYTGTNSFAYSSATYANGVIYVGSIDNYVYAFDAITGSIRWKFLTGTTGIESDAVIVNGTVYVGCNDDYLYAIDAATGNMKWRFLTGGNVSASPTVFNSTVYFGSSDNKLYALDTATGQLRWSFATGAMIDQSGPALANGVIYVGSRDQYLYAIDAITGKQKWRFWANGISLENSSPTVANGIVYIGGWYNINGFTKKGSLYAVNANTEELVWESLTNTGIGSSPTVANGVLYITGDDMNIHAVNALTGASIWSKKIIANGASAAVSENVVYVGGGGSGYFYALDAATGAEKWIFPTPNGIMTSNPLVLTPTDRPDYSGASGLMN